VPAVPQPKMALAWAHPGRQRAAERSASARAGGESCRRPGGHANPAGRRLASGVWRPGECGPAAAAEPAWRPAASWPRVPTSPVDKKCKGLGSVELALRGAPRRARPRQPPHSLRPPTMRHCPPASTVPPVNAWGARERRVCRGAPGDSFQGRAGGAPPGHAGIPGPARDGGGAGSGDRRGGSAGANRGTARRQRKPGPAPNPRPRKAGAPRVPPRTPGR